MKLIIQIPCFNEEEALGETLKALPRAVEGVDRVEILLVDDGSTDRSLEVARTNGIDHLVRFSSHRGLAQAFAAGIDAALRLGADIIVNTDADNQYAADDIPALVRPILEGRADMVVGDRQVETVAHFSATKRRLQRLGSWVVRQVSRTTVPDAASGFRALSREAALQIHIISQFTYTLETIIQAGQKDLALASVPVETRPSRRRSRLFNSTWHYVRRSAGDIVRLYAMYRPLKVFSIIGALVGLAGLALGLRFLYFYLTTPGPTGHVQSLILAAILLLIGFQVLLIGLIADLISANRRLIEDTLYRVRKLELEGRDERHPRR